MRYSDSELFDMTNEEWVELLNTEMKPRMFFVLCMDRLKNLIEESTKQEEWMTAQADHLRNYRLKSIRFYERKLGL